MPEMVPEMVQAEGAQPEVGAESSPGPPGSSPAAAGGAGSSAAEPKMGRRKSLAGEDPVWALAVMQSVLLRKLPVAELKYVKGSLKERAVAADEVLYTQDDVTSKDADDAMFIIKSGRYIASERVPGAASSGQDISGEFGGGRFMREYGRAATFGSFELLYGMPRQCTITCAEAGVVWVVNKRVFDAKLKNPPTGAADPLEQKALLEKVSGVPLFKQAKLSPAQIAQLARAAVEMQFEPGECLCAKGDEAHSVFAVVEGAAVARNEPDAPTTFEFVMNAPSVFGESALASDESLRTRAASVFAVGVKREKPDGSDDESDDDDEGKLMWRGAKDDDEEAKPKEGGCTILSFAVPAIEAVVGFALTKHSLHAYNRKLLTSVKVGETPLVEGLTDEQTAWLLDALVDETWPAGGVVVAEGAPIDALQIVKRGCLVVTSAKDGVITTLGVGDFFGETSFIGGKKTRKSSVHCDPAQPCVLLRLAAAAVHENGSLDAWREKLTRDAKEAKGGASKELKAKATAGGKSRILDSATGASKIKTDRAGAAASATGTKSAGPGPGKPKGQQPTDRPATAPSKARPPSPRGGKARAASPRGGKGPTPPPSTRRKSRESRESRDS